MRKTKILLTLLLCLCLKSGFAQDAGKTTRVTINTSGPVQYEHYTKDEPPSIVIEFKSSNVFSYWDGVMTVNKGAIKEIHAGYYPSRTNTPQALKTLTFILNKKSPYNISQTQDSIIIEVENPSGELSSGEITIPGTFASEIEIQKKEVMDKALLELRQEFPEEKIPLTKKEGAKKNILAQGLNVKEANAKKLKANELLSFLILTVLMWVLGIGYIFWSKYKRSKDKEAFSPALLIKAKSDFQFQQQELVKIREEKRQLEIKLAEKEDLSTRLTNQEILQAQLEKIKKDLEEANLAREAAEDKLRLTEKELQVKQEECFSLNKSLAENEFNFFNQIRAKDESIKQLSDEKESLKNKLTQIQDNALNELKTEEDLIRRLSDEKESLNKILKENEFNFYNDLRVKGELIKQLTSEKESLKNSLTENETNSLNELKEKEELIEALSDEKESLKSELANITNQIRQETASREEASNKLKNIERQLQGVLNRNTSAEIKEEVVKEEVKETIIKQEPQEEKKNPSVELGFLGDEGMLLRLGNPETEEAFFGRVKIISSDGVMAELGQELSPVEAFNMDLFTHGSLKPISLLGKLIQQEKAADSSLVKAELSFISLSRNNQGKINAYIKKIEALVGK